LADEDVDAVADLALDLGLDGIIATNTTIRRDGLQSDTAEVERCGAGGLSGAPVYERSLEVLKRLRAKVGDQLVLISVGGIETAEQAWERIQAGATLVQVYTAFIYEGPWLPSRMARGVAHIARQ
jgi:dihydroorotate dehydrogenase